MDRPITDHKTSRQWIVRGIAVAAVAIGLFILLRSLIAPSIALGDIRVATVETGDIEATIDVTGQVAPASETVLSAPFSAPITEILVSAGAQVHAGDILLRLDSREQSDAAATLLEEYQIKENEKATRAVALRRELSEATGEHELLLIDLESRRARHSRLQKLSSIGAISGGDLLEAGLDVKRTEAQLRQLERTIDNIEDANAAAIRSLELELSILDRALNEARRRIEQGNIRAPQDGILVWISSDQGAEIAEGQAVARIADISRYRVEATASDFHASRIEEGMVARIRVGEIHKTGRINSIAPTQETTGMLTLSIALDEPEDDRLRPQLRADVELITARSENALVVARGPGITGSGPQRAWRIEDDKAIRTDVEIGLSNRRHSELRAGAQEGDVFIISDTSHIDHMQTIEVLP